MIKIAPILQMGKTEVQKKEVCWDLNPGERTLNLLGFRFWRSTVGIFRADYRTGWVQDHLLEKSSLVLLAEAAQT